MRLNVGDISNKIFSEDNGNLSSMRIIVFIIVIVVLFNWTYYNIISGTLTGFNWEDIAVLVGPLLAKSYQKGKEVKKNN